MERMSTSWTATYETIAPLSTPANGP
jgi:hypothetical protein